MTLVYTFGSGEHGQLGNGRTGEHIAAGNKTMYDIRPEPRTSSSLSSPSLTLLTPSPFPYPLSPLLTPPLYTSLPLVLVKSLETKRITQISCGQQHAIAMDDDGFVYVWGFNGYCRLGLGDQKDALIPKVVPHVS